MPKIRITKFNVEEFIPTDEEKLEILTEIINGDYTVEALRQDYEEAKENSNAYSYRVSNGILEPCGYDESTQDSNKHRSF